jgi:hypothetical protein
MKKHIVWPENAPKAEIATILSHMSSSATQFVVSQLTSQECARWLAYRRATEAGFFTDQVTGS